MSLVLNPTQSYSTSANNNLAFQDWQFDPSSPIVVNYLMGSAYPLDIDISVVIKDLIAAYGDAYDKYYVINSANSVVIQSQTFAFIELSGEIAAATNPPGYEVLANNREVTTTMSFINLAVAPESSTTTNIIFSVFGETTATGARTLIEFKILQVKINVINPAAVFVEPNVLNFSHVINAALPAAQTFDVVAPGNFTIQAYGAIALTGGGLSAGSAIPNGQQYTGSGNTEISLALTAPINDENPGTYNTFLVVSNGYNYVSLSVVVALFETGVAVINPSAFEFFAVRNIIEAPWQPLSISAPGAITITKPAWLNVLITSGNNAINTFVLPVLSNNLAPGVYNGFINISNNGNDYSIPVRHTLVENVELNIEEDNINFTDDHNTISNFYELQEYKVQLLLDVRFYNYGLAIENQTQLNYTLGLFQNKVDFFVGRSLNSFMKELLKLTPLNINFLNSLFVIYYKPALVNLQVDFIHQNDVELNKQVLYNDLKFIRGRKPVNTLPNVAILNYYHEPLRVTVNSVVLFNFYKNQNHALRIFRNGVETLIVNHNVGVDEIFGYKVKFNNYQQGDIIEVRLYKNTNEVPNSEFINNPENYLSQKYIVFPEGKNSYHIIWENDNGVLDMMEFTGDITYNMNYEANVIKNYERFKESLRKIDNIRSQKLSCNTGPVLKENTKRLDSLLDAKRAWLIDVKTNESIELIPITKPLENSASDRDIYAYEVEFEINLDNDFKVNSAFA